MGDITNTEYKTSNPIIQKCMDVLKSDKIEIRRVSDFDSFVVYSDKKRAFILSKNTLNGVRYDLEVDNINFNTKGYYEGLDFSDLEKLHKLCVSEWERYEKQRRQHVMDYLEDCIKKSEPDVTTKQNIDTAVSKKRKTLFGVMRHIKNKIY